MRVESETADQIIQIAKREGAALGKALSIAVVDVGGYIVAINRADGARPLTPSIALSKAYSAAVMQRPTMMLEPWAESDPVFFSQVGRLGWQPIVATKGGITLRKDGVFLGGIGISGGTADEDQTIAEVIIAEIGFDSDFAAWAGARK
jgi:uncharacterized protein GlcG (DUF336 family)